jgi:hypothetical protein
MKTKVFPHNHRINIQFSGVAAFMIVVIMQTPELGLTDVAEILDWIFLLFPHYTVTMSVFNLYQTYLSIKVCAPVLEFCPQLPLIQQTNSCCKGMCI